VVGEAPGGCQRLERRLGSESDEGEKAQGGSGSPLVQGDQEDDQSQGACGAQKGPASPVKHIQHGAHAADCMRARARRQSH
jgi:hypothetical protein